MVVSQSRHLSWFICIIAMHQSYIYMQLLLLPSEKKTTTTTKIKLRCLSTPLLSKVDRLDFKPYTVWYKVQYDGVVVDVFWTKNNSGSNNNIFQVSPHHYTLREFSSPPRPHHFFDKVSPHRPTALWRDFSTQQTPNPHFQFRLTKVQYYDSSSTTRVQY